MPISTRMLTLQWSSIRSGANATATISQYDNRSDSVGFNSRLRWTLRPGNDLVLVWNHGWDYEDDRFDNGTGEGVLKIGTTFRF